MQVRYRAALHPELKTTAAKAYSSIYLPRSRAWVGKVVITGFEPVTSALSKQRSKPTELNDLKTALKRLKLLRFRRASAKIAKSSVLEKACSLFFRPK